MTIHNFAFSTKPVRAGATVTIANKDDTAHTVSADNGAFNTAPIFGGTSAHFRAPQTPGTYKFHCNIHANMHGVLTVTG
ncbi:MAG TPA: cupredoxin domain-containing protein [Acidimicrobiia bacterium]